MVFVSFHRSIGLLEAIQIMDPQDTYYPNGFDFGWLVTLFCRPYPLIMAEPSAVCCKFSPPGTAARSALAWQFRFCAFMRPERDWSRTKMRMLEVRFYLSFA